MSRHKSRKSSGRTFGSSVALGLLMGAFGGFLFASTIFLVAQNQYSKVTSISVSGNKVIDSAKIRNSVRSVLAEDCFINATCGYGLWLPGEHVAQVLSSQFPRLERVSVMYSDGGAVSVSVQERTTAFRFCFDELMTACYLADVNGYLFERAPMVSDLRTIPTVIPDASKIKIDATGLYLPMKLWSRDEIEQYHALLDLLQPYARAYRIQYSRRDINVEVDHLYNYGIAGDTAVLKFNRESLNNPERIMYIRASLERLISFQPFADRFKVYPVSLDYLDLRFPKRLYMKFANSETETIGEEKPKVE